MFAMMSQWPHDLWAELDKVVKDGSFMSANEDFTALKNAVLGSSPEELAAQSQNAALAWEFLLGFAAKKTFYRSHVCQVVRALMSAPRTWRQAYTSSAELRSKSAHVHQDIQEALMTEEQATALSVSVPKVPAALPQTTAKQIDWPEWEAISTAVRMERTTGATMGAADEFAGLRSAFKAAGPVDLASQVGHASDVWHFLVSIGEKKAIYRSQIAEVVGILREDEGWQAALEAAMPELRSRIEACPDVIKEALGFKAVEAAGTDLTLKRVVPEQADSSPGEPSIPGYNSLEEKLSSPGEPSSPGYNSLEAKLSSMLGSVADLAAKEPIGDSQAATQGASSSSLEDRLNSMLGQDTKEESDKDPWSWHSTPADAQQRDAGPPPATQEEAPAFLEAASAIEAAQPVVAHYLRVHAIELLMKAKTPEAKPLLLQVFAEAESKKVGLDLKEGQAKMEAFALRAFETACDSELARTDSSKLPELFRSASLFLAALAQFHNDSGMPAGLTQKLAYAQSASRRSLPAAPQLPKVVPATAAEPTAPVATVEAVAPTPGQLSGLSRAKRQKEAKTKSEQAAKALASKEVIKARGLICEALALIEGLSA